MAYFSKASDLFRVLMSIVVGADVGGVGTVGSMHPPCFGVVVQVLPALPLTPWRVSS